MKKTIHPSDSRGFADHGWLQARHSFSFASYYDPERIHFGMLRVLNDDIIAAAKGFGTHPHDNMEIITIPLEGSLEHKDSMGNGSVISAGEVQVMSAGTGIMHSEFNPSQTEEVNLLQIWIFPEKQNVKPRYDQRKFDLSSFKGKIRAIVNNEDDPDTLFIHQKAVLSLGKLSKDSQHSYTIKYPGNGLYLFMIEGKAVVDGTDLSKRDAMGITQINEVSFTVNEDAFILLLEVPMN